jgi:hypothetical protein
MGRLSPSTELFKLFPAADQQEYLNDLSFEINQLQIESQEAAGNAELYEMLAKDSFGQHSGAVDQYESIKTGEMIPKHDSWGLAIGEETLKSAYTKESPMMAEAKDEFAEADGFEYLSKAEKERAKHDALESDLLQKKRTYNTFDSCRDEPQDSDALNAELDDLYNTQKQNYQDYLNNQDKIDRKKNQIELTKGIIFARHGQMEEELKELEAISDQIVSDFIANDDIVRKAAEFLTPEELRRFDELCDKMGAAMEKANKKSGSPEPPKAPKPIVPKPIGNFFAKAGDKIICPFAMGGTAALIVNPSRKTFLDGMPMANIMDFQPVSNIPSFGVCAALSNPAVAAATAAAFGALVPQPCTPSIAAPWAPGKPDLLVEGFPALLVTDTTKCAWGGVISFIPV